MTSEKYILGIESSCDETAAAIVSTNREILSNEIISQIDAHRVYGGVVPEIASRAHMENIERVITAALDKSSKTLEEIDAIAVTSGPGLIGGVIIGVMTAKSIASVHSKPIYAINHLRAHALTARLTEDVRFPYLMLLVSGGHCQILVAHSHDKFTQLGATIDDALGEAFDKTAKMMGLPYPGGPEIEKLAREGDENRFPLPKPLISQNNCNFSFSGLKTAMRNLILERAEANDGQLSDADKADIAASFQKTVVDILKNRLQKAITIFKSEHGDIDTPQLVIAGGVAANNYIREGLSDLAADNQMQLIAPPIKLCTDNAAMIAWAAAERINVGDLTGDKLDDIDPRARWPVA